MTRKHICFVSTAIQSVGRWRRRRSISTILYSRIQPAAPLFFWWRDRLRLRFTFLNRYSQKFIELERQKGLLLIWMLILATESRRMELTIAPIIEKKLLQFRKKTDSAAKPTWRLCSSLVKVQIRLNLITWRRNCNAIKSDKNVKWNSVMCFEVLPVDVNCYLSSNIIG